MLATYGMAAMASAAQVDGKQTRSRPDGTTAQTTSTISAIAGGGECTDNDGDGYGAGDGCLGPDCDDGNAAINPGATETCNGVDDNCDGNTDEGFLFNGPDGDTESDTFLQIVDLPIGADCINGLGICRAFGAVVCSEDGTEAICDAVPGDPDPRGEGLDEGGEVDPTVETCFDRLDNDCDGLVDHGHAETGADTNCTTEEICDGFDNDNNGIIDDGLGLGDPCTVGTGQCTNAGTITCAADGTTRCTASPLPPGIERLDLPGRCSDGVDNDCDTLVDLDDPDCQEPEKCDGADNDGDGEIDEDFVDLGQPCSTGIGPCESSGVIICNATEDGTVCNAVAKTGSPEGPLGETCEDGIDNDCDGMIDDADPSCGASELTATCALPYLRGKPGADCTGWHRVEFSGGGSENAQVTAELLGLDVDGNPIDSLPVGNGEDAHLASRVPEEDFKMVSRTNPKRTWHEVFAPVPLLRVTVQDEFSTTQAFCSNIPYIQVIEPSGGVVNGEEAETPVLVAIPLIDLATLSLIVDGVDVFAGLGLDPATDFPGGPFDGTVEINGKMVQINDLIVDGGPIHMAHSNSLSMKISGLGCGGHVVKVEGKQRADAFVNPSGVRFGGEGGKKLSDACYVDDLSDTGTFSVFTIEVTAPAPGEVTAGGPVNVTGEVCHGQEIASVSINGFDVDVSGQTLTPGDGDTSANTYLLNFDVMVPVTDLRSAVNAGTTGGSFDPGTNRLVAQAVDVDFNTTYDGFIFAVGPIIPAPLPGGGAALAAGLGTTAGGDPSEVEKAFVLALTTDGLDVFFEALKDRNKGDIGQRVKDRMKELRKERNLSVDDSCDPPTVMTIENAEYQNDFFPLELDFRQDEVGVRINLPPIDKTAFFDGYCESGCVCPCFGGCCFCATCTTVNVRAKIVRRDMGVDFNVTEDRILNRTPIDPEFDPGTANDDEATVISGKVDVGCLAGFFLDVAEFFVTVFTLGFVDLDLSEFDFEISGDDLKERMGGLDGDPMDVELVRFRNEELPAFGTRQRDSRLSDVQITPSGIAVAIGAAFEPKADELDPAAADIPGTPLKNPPLPEPPFVDVAGREAGHVTIAISDDVFNQLFYSMTQTGRLRTEFNVVRELGNFLPEDCSTITDSIRQARCVGFQTGDCTVFPFGSDERRACRRARRIKRNHNIGTDTNLILNGRVEVPPVLLIDDDADCPDGAAADDPCRTENVEVVLRYENITITMVADRDGNGVFDTADIAATPECSLSNLDEDSATQSTAATECILWRLCMTIDVNLSMELTENPNTGRSRIKFNFEGIDRELSRGVLCDGQVDVPELDFFNQSSGQTETFDILDDRLRDNTPPLDSEGLELGGFVTFERDRIIAIEAQAPADDNGFQDFIGITGNLVPNP